MTTCFIALTNSDDVTIYVNAVHILFVVPEPKGGSMLVYRGTGEKGYVKEAPEVVMSRLEEQAANFADIWRG